MGGGSSKCGGGHEGQVTENRHKAMDYGERIKNKLKVLNKSVADSKTIIDTKPNYIDNILQIVNEQIPAKVKNYYNVRNAEKKKQQDIIDGLNKEITNKTESLNALFTILTEAKTGVNRMQQGVELNGNYIQAAIAGQRNLAANNSKTINQMHSSIIDENSTISNSINNNNDIYSADNSKNNNIFNSLEYISSVKFWLYVFYYILAFIVIFIFIYNKKITYSNMIFVSIILLYPIFIYTIQKRVNEIWNLIYSYLRLSPPENI